MCRNHCSLSLRASISAVTDRVDCAPTFASEPHPFGAHPFCPLASVRSTAAADWRRFLSLRSLSSRPPRAIPAMSYQMRSASSTGAGMGAGVGAGVGAGDRGSQAFRSSRNDLASTLKAGALAAHEMRSAIPRASAAASPYSAGHAVAASASSSSLLPAIGGATPRSAFAPTAPHGSPSRPAGSASAAFPSTDKEESKESGGSSSSAGASAASKEKDWNLWHGAPVS